MIVYHNQKLVLFHTDFRKRSNPEQMYCQFGYDDLSVAVKTLSHCGLRLFLYLAKNKDGETFPLSPVDVERFTGIKGNTYTKAVKELIATGYLRQRAEGSNYYIFSVVPDAAEVSPVCEGESDAAEVSPMNEGESDAAEVSPVCEGESDAAEVSPVCEGESDAAEVSPMNEGESDAAEVSPVCEGVADAAEVSPMNEGESDAAEVYKVGEFSPEQIHNTICATLNQLAREKYNVNYNPDLDIDQVDVGLALSKRNIIVDDIWGAVIDDILPKKDILPF